MTKEQFIKEIEEKIQNYYAMSKCDMRMGEKKNLAEFELLLDDFIEMGKFDAVDYVVLKRISGQIGDKLRLDNVIFYYSSFHYFYNAVYHNNDFKYLYSKIYQINIQICIMRIQIRHNYITGCSEDDYYFKERGKELLDAIAIIAIRGDKGEDYNPVLYLLLNYIQSLLEYRNGANGVYASNVDILIERGIQIIKKFLMEFESIKLQVKNNVKIRLFIEKINYMYNQYKGVSVEKIVKRVSKIEMGNISINKVWGMNSLFDIDVEMFSEKFNSEMDCYEEIYEDSKIVYLKNYIRWLAINENNKFELLKLPSVSNDDEEDNTWFNLDDYFNGYDKSYGVIINDKDIAKVNSYNDEVLRQKLARLIINVDKNTLERESKKPHGPLEIADMELPVRPCLKSSTYYLCIPVKSGVEIQNKVGEQITYQVIRPFTYFGNKAIVIFISAKEATEAFYNFVKRAKANLNFDIYVIDGKALVKLLKYNKMIE